MGSWEVELQKGFSCTKPIFLEGLPGIGNVGKVVVDYLIEMLKAKKIASFFSHSLPNSVFVNEQNLVQLPVIELYHKRIKGKDFLFLAGDAQPAQEQASYELSVELLSVLKKFSVKEILTLGGIGLNEVPADPQVFVTGNDASYVQAFSKLGANHQVHGVVGPIIGVSGLLLGLSARHEIPAAAILGETFGHPLYVGLKEAKSIIELLNKRYSLSVDLKQLDEEISSLETMQQEQLADPAHPDKPKLSSKYATYKDTNYIG